MLSQLPTFGLAATSSLSPAPTVQHLLCQISGLYAAASTTPDIWPVCSSIYHTRYLACMQQHLPHQISGLYAAASTTPDIWPVCSSVYHTRYLACMQQHLPHQISGLYAAASTTPDIWPVCSSIYHTRYLACMQQHLPHQISGLYAASVGFTPGRRKQILTSGPPTDGNKAASDGRSSNSSWRSRASSPVEQTQCRENSSNKSKEQCQDDHGSTENS